jgi:glycosyltransferase involved in cell wall biosynthesis
MKILLLSDTYSEHTEKWALGLADKGIHVGLFSFNKASYEWHLHPNITVYFEPDSKIDADSFLTKVAYIKYVSILKKIIKQFKPDILHAHYATSYGLIGALTGFKPFILSVWGSDVYSFPKKSKLHKKIFQYNLKKASVLLSTSNVMKEEVQLYTKKDVIVTPFGVDTDLFKPQQHQDKDPSITYIGTIKPIEEKYGIIYIIDAADIIIKKYTDKKFKFYLVGPGNDLNHYHQLIEQKGLKDYFVVTGRIPFSQVQNYHNLLDIFLNVSIDDSESFGVAVVEAMACEKPVIVTDAKGLVEVVGNGDFAKIVPKKNAQEIANAIADILNFGANTEIGKKARQHVLQHYDWKNNLQLMITIYNQLIKK